jgi:16S rRNA (adenine1518-N6/adenine1519-N6)-dimethyltransferase
MLNVKPKKRLGQHFLTEPHTADKITELLKIDPQLPVYEIGPGKGVLSQRLIGKVNELHLLEIDTESIQYLKAQFPPSSFQIHETDVLQWAFPAEPSHKFRVIGNLPYNITSPIFFHLLEYRQNLDQAVFMIQKEVAERICTPPGKHECGILSVLLSTWFECKYHFTVPPGAFFPPPKVNSAVITITQKTNPPDIEFGRFLKLVKAAFGQRRKMLRNALSGLNFIPSESLDQLFTKRAEALSLEEFFWLEKQLK